MDVAQSNALPPGVQMALVLFGEEREREREPRTTQSGERGVTDGFFGDAGSSGLSALVTNGTGGWWVGGECVAWSRSVRHVHPSYEPRPPLLPLTLVCKARALCENHCCVFMG